MVESHTRSHRATVLIVEDDDATASDLEKGLIGAGYAVPRAGSAAEALVALESTHADLVLLNLMLPDADGLIVCSTLKAHFQVPVIVLTARAGEVDRALALRSGAIDCLRQPVDRDELLAQVTAVVQLPFSVPVRAVMHEAVAGLRP